MVRQSKIELLRIICMMFILIHHVLTGALPLSSYGNLTEGAELLITKILDALCYVAVNVFVLISGYFTIRPSWRSFLNLWMICVFYTALSYMFYLYQIGDFHIGKSILFVSLFPFGRNPGWWFIGCYILLYFVSPLLNLIIEKLSQKQLLGATLLLLGINLYFGHIWRSEFINSGSYASGYNLFQFINLYFIGNYIRQYAHCRQENIKICFIIYFLCSCLLGVLYYLDLSIWHTNSFCLKIYDYNHPLVLVSAVSFFLVFVQLPDFHSVVVNYIAKSCLPLFLLHCNCFTGQYVYSYLADIYTVTTPPLRGVLRICRHNHIILHRCVNDRSNSYMVFNANC